MQDSTLPVHFYLLGCSFLGPLLALSFVSAFCTKDLWSGEKKKRIKILRQRPMRYGNGQREPKSRKRAGIKE